MDETSWLLHGERQWWWGMAPPAVASCQRYPKRSQAAFAPLLGAWTELLAGMTIGPISAFRDCGRAGSLLSAARPRGRLRTSREGVLALANACTERGRGCVLGARSGPRLDRGGRGIRVAERCAPPDPGRHSRDVGPTVGASRGGPVAVAGRPEGGSNAEHRGARASLRGLVAQTPTRDRQRKGQPLGGARPVCASPLSHSRASDVSSSGRPGSMPVAR